MGLEVQELEKQLPSPLRIFVANEALAFFDVNNLGDEEPISIAQIAGKTTQTMYKGLSYTKRYDYSVNQCKIHYFRTDGYDGPFLTVSVTTPCIIFCGYTTDENGRIKSSGVYHAASMPPSKEFQDRLYKLIDVVKPESGGKIIVKAAGSNEDENHLQRIRSDLTGILAAKGVEIKPEHLLLGGGSYRITEFHPRTCQLISYFFSEQKTVL